MVKFVINLHTDNLEVDMFKGDICEGLYEKTVKIDEILFQLGLPKISLCCWMYLFFKLAKNLMLLKQF